MKSFLKGLRAEQRDTKQSHGIIEMPPELYNKQGVLELDTPAKARAFSEITEQRCGFTVEIRDDTHKKVSEIGIAADARRKVAAVG